MTALRKKAPLLAQTGHSQRRASTDMTTLRQSTKFSRTCDLNPVKVKAEEQSVLEFKNLATV
jgi:hypothetical protein